MKPYIYLSALVNLSFLCNVLNNLTWLISDIICARILQGSHLSLLIQKWREEGPVCDCAGHQQCWQTSASAAKGLPVLNIMEAKWWSSLAVFKAQALRAWSTSSLPSLLWPLVQGPRGRGHKQRVLGTWVHSTRSILADACRWSRLRSRWACLALPTLATSCTSGFCISLSDSPFFFRIEAKSVKKQHRVTFQGWKGGWRVCHLLNNAVKACCLT